MSDLAEGDAVTLVTTQSKPTYWYENKAENVIYRAGGFSGEATFTVKPQGKGILLRTASGRYVGPAKDGSLTTTDKESDALAFEVIKNPSVAKP